MHISCYGRLSSTPDTPSLLQLWLVRLWLDQTKGFMRHLAFFTLSLTIPDMLNLMRESGRRRNYTLAWPFLPVIKCVGRASLPTHLITGRKGLGYQANYTPGVIIHCHSLCGSLAGTTSLPNTK